MTDGNEYGRLLPETECPFCKKPMGELLMNGACGGDVVLSLRCDCIDFGKAELYGVQRLKDNRSWMVGG